MAENCSEVKMVALNIEIIRVVKTPVWKIISQPGSVVWRTSKA